MRAHTATHLLNWSLRNLTSDARQNGSQVGEDRLYFEVFMAVSVQSDQRIRAVLYKRTYDLQPN